MKDTTTGNSTRIVILSLAGIAASTILASCETMASNPPPRTPVDPLDRAEMEADYIQSVEDSLYFSQQQSGWNRIPTSR